MKPSGATVREGDELPPLELKPDLGQVVRFCALGWVFPPFFFDVEAARAQGMPGLLVPGPLKLGLIHRAVDEWLQGAGFVRHVRAAHRRPDLQGRPITILGHVARVYDEDGCRRADIEVIIQNERGEPSVRGFAVVQFTS
jgi:acyl dehydratase